MPFNIEIKRFHLESISSTFFERVFCTNFWHQKSQSQNETREKLLKSLSYEKHMHKMLMKLAPGIDFTNILRKN